jgi:hypothetical protein
MARFWRRKRIVTETTQRGRSPAHGHWPRGTLLQRRGRLLVTLAFIIGAIGGYVLGFQVAHRDIQDAKQLIQQLQTESQKFKKELLGQTAAVINMKSDLARVHAALNKIMPSKDVYNIYPNQALNAADGRLTIGMIGSPTNDSINININGKQHVAASGDVINVSSDPSNACRVEIQSFDMFKAVVIATCASAKPR